MARTRNSLKRQKVATVESVLFNPDVVIILADLLDARDLSQVSQTCKALGGEQAAYGGLSLVEEAARRLLECASEWERSCLPKYDGEGWVELYHHLMMLRSKLTFDQIVGFNIEYGDDQSTVQASPTSWMPASALCSNQVMRSGRHFAVFMPAGIARIGVMRPVRQIDVSATGLSYFDPRVKFFWEHLLSKRTDRWDDSNVHYCGVTIDGNFDWSDWTSNENRSRYIAGLQREVPFGLLLDLDEGTLSLYQDGQRLETLKDGLSGEYCWCVTVYDHDSGSIRRGSASAC